MKEAGGAAPGMTAAHIAVAVVAACGVTGTKPDRAFDDGDGQGRTRVMAAAGCIARLGWCKKDAARVFRVHPNRLTPSGLQLARVWTEHLLVIAEALAAHGLCEGDAARARFLRPYGPGAGKPETPPDPSTPAAAAATPQHKAGGGEAAPAPVDSVRMGPACPPRAAAVEHRPAPIRAARPRPASVERLRPVTDRVIRWTRQQLALGADLDFVAWCFGVDAEALAAGVRPRVAVAA